MSRRIEKDSDLRPTPFALALPDMEEAERRFAAIAEEARTRGSDPEAMEAFVQLGEVALLLDTLRGSEPPVTGDGDGDGEGEEGEAGLRSPGVQGRFAAFLALLHHAYRHQAGALHAEGQEAGPAPLLLDVSMEFARYLVEATPQGRISRLPARSGYLRLPRNLFWVTPGGAGTPPEPLDGISWTTQRALLHLLAVSGIVPGRPGFSVIPLPALELPDVEAWLAQPARNPAQGPDFQTTLPGGELGGLYSIETPAELVKLAARVFVASGLPPGEGRGGPPPTSPPGEDFDAVFRQVPLRLDDSSPDSMEE